MSLSQLFWWQLGGLSGALAIGCGAFGAHALKSRVTDPSMLNAWNTAAQYHLLHSVMLMIVPLVMPHTPSPWAARLFTAGMCLFSGSLYAMALSNQRKVFGPITPIGGLALMAGWIALALRV